MEQRSTTRQMRLNKKRAWKESGQTLHEVLIASSILAIGISGLGSSIIRSNHITHLSSLRKAAESVIANDLESTVKRRFYTFRCSQGPCQSATEDNDQSLMYYESENKEDFIERCNARDLARELLEEEGTPFTDGQQSIPSPLDDQGITITRTISLNGSNENQAIIEYEAEKNNEVIATIKSTLVPNAVHWCS